MSIAASILWSLLATTVLTGIFQVSRGSGLSRLNLPLLFGALFAESRTVANLLGMLLYFIGGWFFTLGYLRAFEILDTAGWLPGLLLGAAHGLALLTVLFPIMPYLHPRMATDYDAPTSKRRLEPPGFLALNYGPGTPLTALLAHSAFGLTLGIAAGSTGH